MNWVKNSSWSFLFTTSLKRGSFPYFSRNSLNVDLRENRNEISVLRYEIVAGDDSGVFLWKCGLIEVWLRMFPWFDGKTFSVKGIWACRTISLGNVWWKHQAKLMYLLQEQYIICCLVLPHSIIAGWKQTWCAETPGLPPTDQSYMKTSLLSKDAGKSSVANEKSYISVNTITILCVFAWVWLYGC